MKRIFLLLSVGLLFRLSAIAQLEDAKSFKLSFYQAECSESISVKTIHINARKMKLRLRDSANFIMVRNHFVKKRIKVKAVRVESDYSCRLKYTLHNDQITSYRIKAESNKSGNVTIFDVETHDLNLKVGLIQNLYLGEFKIRSVIRVTEGGGSIFSVRKFNIVTPLPDPYLIFEKDIHILLPNFNPK